VLVTRYEVVSHDAEFAALNSELMTAYVAAVIVPSKPSGQNFSRGITSSGRMSKLTEEDIRHDGDLNPEEAPWRLP